MARIRTAVNTLAGTTGKNIRVAFEALAAKGAVVGTSKIVTKTVTVDAAAASGTATVVAGSTILGIYPAGNQDQLVDNVAISTTTLTVTLAANATATNTYKVVVLEP
ncbi:hypothetical protein QM806_04375 [Rhodococcus sp. IEGM 1351]|uniref:hypothetical protein n=1 Tax=Rhodococcus sp. IEGM 1351 TaxID=3047089 RepID=UPI0024B6697B|nr:hypothetical protein [Rhodococcus sp. IEGM 1351]MDI9934690.1 hypothetical protein [Rhodococcus sp. IEGM 1351]